MIIPASLPFKVEPVDEQLVVVRFGRICDHLRTKEHYDAVYALMDRYQTVVFDLSETEIMTAGWLRWLKQIMDRAETAGKPTALRGTRDSVLETAAVLGLRESLIRAATVEGGA